jgi:glycine/D-amino acid oxidase-like deaminating enzyme
MDRRSFLGAVAAASLAGVAKATPRTGSKIRIGIVGGGIVGAAIAMRCAQAGADVTLLEKVAPAAGATSKSLAWINAFMDDDYYMKMRLRAIDRWQAINKTLNMGVVWGGYVNFTDREADRGRMAAQVAHLAAAGQPTKMIDGAELKRLAPEIQPGKFVEAIYSPSGGHVDPVDATRRFLAAATAAGAKILYPCPVTAIEPGGKGVTLVTGRGRMAFDRVLIAGGVDAPAMLASLGYAMPLVHSPGALMHTKPMPPMTRLVYDGPGILEWKQAANGSVVGLEASVPPSLPVHEEILKRVVAFPPGIAEMHGARILSKLAAYTPALAQGEVSHVTLGFRPMPKDGFPIVGSLPGIPAVSVCVTHSGVTLAPLLGDFMAAELVEGRDEPSLAPYRPGRFGAVNA